jgi:hypothetical protein
MDVIFLVQSKALSSFEDIDPNILLYKKMLYEHH